MRKLILVISFALILSACGKNPSQLACSVWNDKLAEAELKVDYWAELSATRKLSPEEEREYWREAQQFLAILKEAEKLGCKTKYDK